jgi:IS5 family transposase
MAAQIGRYAHAMQFKSMRKALNAHRIRVGRECHEVTPKIAQLPEQGQAKAKHLLHRVGRILTQKTRDKKKLHALHAPEAECISKVQGQDALRVRRQSDD